MGDLRYFLRNIRYLKNKKTLRGEGTQSCEGRSPLALPTGPRGMLFRWREKRGNLNLRELAFPRARRRRGVDGSVVCDTAEARRTIKYVGLVSFRCKSEQCRKTNNINKRRLMGQSCKSALIFIQKSSDLKHQENFSKGTP